MIRGLAGLLLCGLVASCGRGVPGNGPAPDGWAGASSDGAVQDSALAIPPLPLPWLYERAPAADEEAGLEVRLSTVAANGAAPGVATPPPSIQPLTDARAETLLARLPALPAEPVAEPFRFPAASPPPPRTGRIQLATFPPPADAGGPAPPATPAREPLRVTRVTPEGDAMLAPHVTITFSEAMVPLTTVAQAEAGAPPARLTPQPPGRWTWLDTRTLRFQPEGRLPNATQFTLEVPAGTRSATGQVLAQAVRFSFATPALRATGAWPAIHPDDRDEYHRRPGAGASGDPRSNARSVRLDPVMVVAFDQEVNAEAVLRSARLRADGRELPVRLATAAEVAADSVARRLTEGLQPGRWVAFRPSQPLPRDAEVRLVLLAGTASAEGPRTTKQAQSLRFRTYGPLRIASHGCWSDQCAPGMPWHVQFTNVIDSATWAPSALVVQPELRDMTVSLAGGQLRISGLARPNTRYRVTLPAGLRDVFGQPLDGERTVTINVGAPQPALALPGEPMLVLDPAGPPRVAVRAWGIPSLRVRLYRVAPEDWLAWGDSLERWQRTQMGTLTPPGRLVESRTVDLPGRGQEFAETFIDIAPAFTGRYGHAILIVEPASSLPFGLDRIRRPLLAHTWVQSTELGLAAAADGEELLVWASSLRTGDVLGGVDVRTLPGASTVRTAVDGTARFALTASGEAGVVARRGEDAALLPSSQWPSSRNRGWTARSQPSELRWYTVTDRGLYRPGETVHLKGWVRRRPAGRSVEPVIPGDLSSIQFALRGPRGEELASGSLTPGGLGGFHTTIDLPEAVNLGMAPIELRAVGARTEDANSQFWHNVRVDEFRRPDYEVRVSADPGPHLVGGSVDVDLSAQYYAGGGLGDATLEWRVRTRPGSYSPPGWQRWHFGRAPWWMQGGGEREHVLHASTDAAGTHRLRVDLLSVDPPFPASVRAEAQVHDVTRQVGSGGVDLLVHPAAVTAGVRLQRGWLRPGETTSLDVVVVDLDGAAVAGRPVVVSVERLATGYWPGRAGAGQGSVAREACRLTSGVEPMSCAFTVDSAGTHRLRADVMDASGRTSRTELMLHVGGASGPPNPNRPPGTFEVIADRDEYQPGDTARLLVQAPFHPAEALVTIRGAGILSSERVRITSDAHELRVPVTDAHLSGVAVRVDLVDAADGVSYAHGETTLTVPPRRRELEVQVTPADTVALPGGSTAIDVVIRDAAGRAMANAEVALWMVDEAILALGGFTLPDPLDVFYSRRHGFVQDQHSRGWVVHWPRSAGPGTLSGVLLDDGGRTIVGAIVRLADANVTATTGFDGRFTLRGVPPGEVVLVVTTPDGVEARRTLTVPAEGLHAGNIVFGADGIAIAQTAAAEHGVVALAPAPPPPPMAARQLSLDALVVTGAEMAGADGPVDVRADFAPLAFFEPSLRTDANGRVRVDARLPESLTRYRVMAVAVAGADRFGTGEATVTARKDLLVRIMAPRFLHQGDRIELPVLVQNASSVSLPVEVAVRAAGIDFTALRGQQVTLPAGGRAELLFAGVAPRAGSAHIQAMAVSGALTDAASARLPVLTPATVEAFAVHGSTDADAAIVLPLARPQGVIEAFGGLEVTLTSTALHSLTDAVLYLHDYPFRGTEHIASRVLAVAALRDVLRAFDAEGLPSPDSLLLATERDIADLVARQQSDGAWSFWPGFVRTDPFVSIHVAHSLQRAHEKGFAVPPATLQRAARYLAGIDLHVARWSQPARQGANAYAVYVRHRMGDPGAVADARRMASAAPTRVGGELPVEAAGWLLHVLAQQPAARGEADALRRAIMNRLVETAGTATFAERYEDAAHLLLHSRRRTDAVVLEALIAADADDDVVIKLAQSLLAHRVAGRWSGTQENAWVLLALDGYFRTYEATTPAFTGRVWLGERFAGGSAFEGRTTDRQEVRVPMPDLIAASAPEVVIAREGEGRLYYRAGLRYAPADPRVPATDRGFLVSRRYEAVDDPDDVRRDADGTWHVRPGARVRVTLSMVAPSVRHHVALVDPLPAGFEPLNPELQGTGFADDAPVPPPPPGRGAPPPPPPPGSIRGGAPVGADLGIARPGPGPWQPRWFEHQNLRDDRAEAFTAYLQAGAWEYSYLARATTPGTFVVPPPRAEMMYEPETFGRGEGAVVVIGGGAGR